MNKKIISIVIIISILSLFGVVSAQEKESHEQLLVALGLLTNGKEGYITNAELSEAAEILSVNEKLSEEKKPEEAASVDTLLYVAVRALGYPKENYKSYTSEVLKNVVLDEKYVTKEIYAGVMYNTLTNERVKLSRFDGDRPVFLKQGTLLKDLFNVKKVTDIVQADFSAYINYDSNQKLAKDEIFVGGIAARGADNTKKYLGRRIEAYIKLDENDEKRGVLLAAEKSGNEEIKKTSEVIDGATTSKKLVWLDKESDKLKSKEIPKEAVVICNGKRMGNAWSQEWSLFTPGDGEVNLIDNNSDGNIDVVIIWNYNLYVTDYVNSEEKIIACRNFAYGITVALEGKNYFIFDENGAALSLTDIKPYDILCITDTSEENVYIACSKKETAEGIYRRSGYSIYVGNDRYSIGNSGLYDFSSFSDGDKVRVYFDIYDRTAYIVRLSEYEYAFLNKVYYAYSEDEPMYLKLYTADGNVVQKELADKVKVIDENGTETNYFRKKSGNNSFSVLAGLLDGRYELIKYRENTLGKVTRIMFARSKIGQDIPNTTGGFDIYYGNASGISLDFKEAKYLQNMFVSRYRIMPDTLIFSVEEDKSKPEKFRKLSMSDLSGDSDYRVMIYDVDSRFKVGAVVLEKYTDWYAKYGSIVTDISKEAGEDGEILTRITLFTRGEENVIYAEDCGIKTNSEIAVRFGNTDATLADIAVGDIIYYKTGQNGYVTGIAYLHKNISGQAFYHKSNYGWGDIYIPNCAMAVIHCPVKSVYDDMFVIYSDGSMPVMVNENINYYVCERNKLRKTDFSELTAGDTIVGLWKWSGLNDVIIYR